MGSSKANRAPVLIANRGEIAVRIARTCRALGFPSVAVYSDADRFAEHVRMCDQAYWIGEPAPSASYLNVDRLLDVARRSGAKYIHPGYGFLSERAEFVKRAEEAGLVFVGPSPDSIDRMGDKVRARETADAAGVPGVPGSKGAVKDAKEAARFAAEVGYPVLLKAKAGGGGKGMRRVDSEQEIEPAFEAATREAVGAFGDGDLYIEKYILEPHHVEIQVFGDGKGGAVHLGERECSIQRRHQKIWEESPSPILNQFPETRQKMFKAAEQLTSHLKYSGAGTLEFIVDAGGGFYFLEMNTRLQVEHPVTEWVTGVDLVAWQLLLSAGEFELPKAAPETSGSSIEVRIYAEDPYTFLPAAGPIGSIRPPAGSFVRWDSAFGEKGEVSVHYDPMIAKLSVWGRDRGEALNRIRAALDETAVTPQRTADGMRKGGLRTNLPFLRRLTRNKDVLKGDTPTDLIPKNPELIEKTERELTLEAAIALSVYQITAESEREGQAEKSDWTQERRVLGQRRAWTRAARWEGVR